MAYRNFIQGATIERSPPLLQSIEVEGVNVLLSHPVGQRRKGGRVPHFSDKKVNTAIIVAIREIGGRSS